MKLEEIETMSRKTETTWKQIEFDITANSSTFNQVAKATDAKSFLPIIHSQPVLVEEVNADDDVEKSEKNNQDQFKTLKPAKITQILEKQETKFEKSVSTKRRETKVASPPKTAQKKRNEVKL